MQKQVAFILTGLVFIGGIVFALANLDTLKSDYPSPETYAPNLWFDSEEKYYPTNPLDFYYDENFKEIAGRDARQKYDGLTQKEKLENFKVYYNIDDSGNELVYQYWLFYVFNDGKINEHYGDWESAFLFIDDETNRIQKIIGSAHNGTETKIILANNELVNPANVHSRILVEDGSHANWIDGNTNGLVERRRDVSNWYNAYRIKDWSSTDKLHGLKVEHDSPYYNLRPISEIRDVFGKKYGEDAPLISKEKSPTLGMLPIKIGKNKFHVLPLGGDPPQNAWNKKEYKDPNEALPMTPTRLAQSIGGFLGRFDSALAAVGKSITSPISNLFGASFVGVQGGEENSNQAPLTAGLGLIQREKLQESLVVFVDNTEDVLSDSEVDAVQNEITTTEEVILSSDTSQEEGSSDDGDQGGSSQEGQDEALEEGQGGFSETDQRDSTEPSPTLEPVVEPIVRIFEPPTGLAIGSNAKDFVANTPSPDPEPEPDATSTPPEPEPEPEPESTPQHLVINEIKINDSEFVELYNPTDEAISLDGYYFSYYPSSRITWSGTSTPNGPWINKVFPEDAAIPANGYYLIGVKDYPSSGGNPNSDWDLGFIKGKLNNSKGTVAIFPFNPKTATSSQYAYENRADAVGWSADISLYEQSPENQVPLGDESLTRDEDHTDTDNNSDDFSILASPTPTNSGGEIYDPDFSTEPLWAMYQNDSQHSGLSTLSGPTWSTSSEASVKWTFSMSPGFSGVSQPVVDYMGVVYVIDGSGIVYAINLESTEAWKFEPTAQGDGAGWASASPALSADSSRLYSVYTDIDDNKLILYSIKTVDGMLDWKYSVVGVNNTFTSPVVDFGGNIYVASKYKIYSISSSGSLNWEKSLGNGFWTRTPAVGQDGYIYVTAKVSNNSGDRYIWKLDPSDGSEIWKTNPLLGNSLFNGVSINASGTIFTGGYLNSGTSGLYSIDPSNGSENWRSILGDVAGLVPSFDADGNVYIGTVGPINSGAFHKIKSATSTLEWTFHPTSPSAVNYPSVVDSQGRVYVGAKNKFVYALRPEDGTVIWQYQLSDEPRGFAIGDGVLYAVSYDGKVYAFGN